MCFMTVEEKSEVLMDELRIILSNYKVSEQDTKRILDIAQGAFDDLKESYRMSGVMEKATMDTIGDSGYYSIMDLAMRREAERIKEKLFGDK